MVHYAISYVSNVYHGKQLTIGIIEESNILKEWYLQLGFIHTGTMSIETLPFTVGYMEYNW